jgi:hypothetical protein
VAIDSRSLRSRRAILGAALGGVGALVAQSLGRAAPVAAANDDTVLLGQGTTATDNAATLPTIVNSSADALGGVSSTGIGVYGRSTGPTTPGHSTGVIGATGDGTAIRDDTSQIGVYGFSDDSNSATGVWGESVLGTGVVGTGSWGVYGTGGAIGVIGTASSVTNGVYGFSGDDNPFLQPLAAAGVLGTGGAGGGVGVRGHAATGGLYGVLATAASSTQYALYVSGKVHFSRSGRVSMASTATSKKVVLAGVTTSSFVVATLQTSISGCSVRAVVPATGSFTIYLSKAPGKTAAVGYVVMN